MKIILTADIDNLGAPGDTVEVKDGYGRNYLLPRGLAIRATPGAEKQVEQLRKTREAHAARKLATAQQAKESIDGIGVVTLKVRTAGGAGKLFGSVSSADVATALKQAGGPALDRRVLELPSAHIKSTGKYIVEAKLHAGVSAKFNLLIAAAN
jgi:large subunit ribosomal protein L9